MVASKSFHASTASQNTLSASIANEQGTAHAEGGISHWSETSKQLLGRLLGATDLYATVNIKGRLFTVTKGDMVVMDRMNDLSLGDVIKLTSITELGSLEHTLKGSPLISAQLADIEATVVEHPESSQMTIFKKKRRKGYQRTLFHKQRVTCLRISKFDPLKL
ncbi:Homocitrate dehydratase, mitochondrial [Smittium culicis]|uniref:Large ribosomal subunit protein bL21m n=1 Tax=Smittium culicis TaxID=133412 RepID=A0A1R1X8R6_9FUNG|nr:Homocitrate dehydratase, mitochondrial [Smittium culicis]OMJ12345.1 Homocitrate dehydratase, mitochondrial [Smittium culicis]